MRRLAPVVLLTAAQIPFMFSSYQPVVVGYTTPQAPPVRPSGLSRGSVAYTRSLTLAQQRNEVNFSYTIYYIICGQTTDRRVERKAYKMRRERGEKGKQKKEKHTSKKLTVICFPDTLKSAQCRLIFLYF